MVNNQTSQYKLLYNFFLFVRLSIFQYVRAILQLSLPRDHQPAIDQLVDIKALLHPSLELEPCMGSMTMSGTNTQLYLLPSWIKPDWLESLYAGPFCVTVFDLAYS